MNDRQKEQLADALLTFGMAMVDATVSVRQFVEAIQVIFPTTPRPPTFRERVAMLLADIKAEIRAMDAITYGPVNI